MSDTTSPPTSPPSSPHSPTCSPDTFSYTEEPLCTEYQPNWTCQPNWPCGHPTNPWIWSYFPANARVHSPRWSRSSRRRMFDTSFLQVSPKSRHRQLASSCSNSATDDSRTSDSCSDDQHCRPQNGPSTSTGALAATRTRPAPRGDTVQRTVLWIEVHGDSGRRTDLV